MSNVLRIIDANANRSREAIRVMEEAARFLLEDRDLSAQLKRLRHDLVGALGAIDGLDANRDTPGDVGTTIQTECESQRQNVFEVAVAAGKRLSEALRSIEEYGKTLGDAAGRTVQMIEAIRYRGYTLEQNLITALATGRRRQWRLCVLLSESVCPQSRGSEDSGERRWMDVLVAMIEAGADCIQLREKYLDDSELLKRAQMVVARCRKAHVSVVINDRADIALLSGADGVHLGQSDLSCAQVRKMVGRRLLVGVSTSELDMAKRALADGADYCGVGPMFESATKHKPVIAGPSYLRQFVSWGKLPHLAIGGIDTENIYSLVEAGAHGVAVSRAVCSAKDPAAVVRRMLDALAAGPADSEN